MDRTNKPSRRDFLKNSMLSAGSVAVFGIDKHIFEVRRPDENSIKRFARLQSFSKRAKISHADWLQTARVFLLDAYQPPLVPELQYDPVEWAEMMVDMNVNVIRFGTMGKYATIQGTRFSVNREQGNRDLLQETIEACAPRGIKVFAYISTGHKLAWSMVTEDYSEYGQKISPGGTPARSHMYVGEDMGTVCWMSPYKKAWIDYVTHVVRDYDIQGVYFDKLVPFYFWPGRQLCYCPGCKTGFYEATGKTIPYHEDDNAYTPDEIEAIKAYHYWYKQRFMADVVQQLRPLVKSHKDIPLMSNINNPQTIAATSPHIIEAMDAFLYERGDSILERAEGVGVPRSVGLHIWPYVGVYHNWPRLAFQGVNYQQEIFTNLMFGAGSIIAQPTGYIRDTENRNFVRYPFGVIKEKQELYKGLVSSLYVGVVYAYNKPEEVIENGWLNGTTVDPRTSTLGAFSACLYNHIQVGAVSEFVLDDPKTLRKYPVLYLANISFLNRERIENISEYVENGGCLIASYATALFDDAGERQAKFGLENLFKVKPITPDGELKNVMQSYRAMTGGPNDLYLLATEEDTKISSENAADNLFPLWYYQPVEVIKGGRVIMDIVTGYDRNPILPGVIRSDYGKGRVLYCAAALESLYNLQKPKVIGSLIRRFVEMTAKEPAPYMLSAPDCLLANLTEKDNIKVLHLTNWTGNKYEKNLMNEYHLAPVENVSVRIRIPKGRKVKSIAAIIDADYTKRVSENEIELVFPRIDAYQAVVVEMD